MKHSQNKSHLTPSPASKLSGKWTGRAPAWGAFAALLTASAILMPACAPAKKAPQHKLVMQEDTSAKTDDVGPETWTKLKLLFDTYASGDRLSKTQIENILSHFSPRIAKVIALATETDENKDYSFTEFSEMLQRRCLTLAWLRVGTLSDATARLATLTKFYATAKPQSVKALSDAIGSRSKINLTVREIFEIGVVLSEEKKLFAKTADIPLYKKLLNKTIWITLPDFKVSEITDADREISQLILGLNMKDALDRSLAKSAPAAGATEAPADADAAPALPKGVVPSTGPETLPQPTRHQLALRASREAHKAYFSLAAAKANLAGAEGPVEDLDWSLNLRLAPVIKKSTDESLADHMKLIYPALFESWDPKQSFFADAAHSKVPDDLLVATFTDDLMQLCKLTPSSPMTREFVDIFAMGLKKMKITSDTECDAIEKEFHLSPVQYHVRKLELELHRSIEKIRNVGSPRQSSSTQTNATATEKEFGT